MAAQRGKLGILALVPDDWPVAWQRRHQMLTRLARSVPVAWISPPGLWRARAAGHPARPIPSNMFVLGSTDGLPVFWSHPWWTRFVRRRRAAHGARWLRERGCRRIELQLWFPDFADALDWGLHDTASYHIDDEYSWSPVDRPMSPQERALIERVDRVVVTSAKLLETKGGINPRTMLSPNGVDVAAFSTPVPEPPELSGVPHPRVGYVGALKEQLDWDLLEALADRRPDWSFVFVGPVRHASLAPRMSILARRANVHVLGERAPGELPAYVQHVDVSLLPYRENDYTNAINPLKLYEALAAGVPVVSARIRAAREFSDVVALATGVDEWNAAIAGAITEGNAGRHARQTVARSYDWNDIAAAYLDAVAPRGSSPPT